MVREKLIDRIRKLHNMAESAKKIGNEAEALAFASKVAELLAEHKMGMTDIQMAEMEREEPILTGDVLNPNQKRQKVRQAWMQDLASVVARAHYCRILVSTGSNDIWLVGRASDRMAAEYMITFLTTFAEQESFRGMKRARKEEKAKGNFYGARGYRQAWLKAFVRTVANRYYADMEARRTEAAHRTLAPGATGSALARLDSAEAAIQQYMDQRFGRGSKAGGLAGSRAWNSIGSEHGAKAGASVAIRGGGIGSGSGRALGSGQ